MPRAQVAGDPQILEVELAKLKVLVNDIAAHQASVDTLNEAGAQIVQQGTGMSCHAAFSLLHCPLVSLYLSSMYLKKNCS